MINQSARLITDVQPLPPDRAQTYDAYAGYEVRYVGGGGTNNNYQVVDPIGGPVRDGQGNVTLIPDSLVYLDPTSASNYRVQAASYQGLYDAILRIQPSLLQGTSFSG
ncbi:hypothetical protein ABS71_15105 [bacterium SCN 62-11]|nr:MAG: hypothetical protein ABS71_15105 [bacterium SCN 62-11]